MKIGDLVTAKLFNGVSLGAYRQGVVSAINRDGSIHIVTSSRRELVCAASTAIITPDSAISDKDIKWMQYCIRQGIRQYHHGIRQY